ncbi:MAG: alpha/beta hydrolase [Bacteroidales bacterium]|nr:alpha/beta hydrolase [Bacteroidales bacterium]
MGFVKVKGHDLHYRFLCEEYRNPENPVIVFLHEGLGSIPQWKEFPGAICEKLKLPGLLYERYGYGQSDILEEERDKYYLIYEGIEALPELLEELRVKNNLILIGHSDGASIALAYASKYSNNICCLIAEAPHVFIEDISARGIEFTIRAFENTKLKSSLEKFHGHRTESMFYGWANTWTSKGNFSWNMEYMLSDISCPVFVIQGEEDEYGSDKQVYSIVNKVSGPAKSLLIPDCGHTPHFQMNEIVMNEMITYINKYK